LLTLMFGEAYQFNYEQLLQALDIEWFHKSHDKYVWP